MSQPVFFIRREKVIEIIKHRCLFARIPNGMEWGKATSEQELIDAVNSLKREPDDMLNVSRLAQCINRFETAKMPARANIRLKELWNHIKCYREVL